MLDHMLEEILTLDRKLIILVGDLQKGKLSHFFKGVQANSQADKFKAFSVCSNRRLWETNS